MNTYPQCAGIMKSRPGGTAQEDSAQAKAALLWKDKMEQVV